MCATFMYEIRVPSWEKEGVLEKRDDSRDRRYLRVSIDSGYGPVYGTSVNVSPTGMGITLKTKRVFKPGDKVTVVVSKSGKSYTLSGEVRWFRFEVLSRSLGIEFDRIHDDFCHDIVRREIAKPGSKEAPFQKVYESDPSFAKEYVENIKFGGLLIPFVGDFPPLNSNVWIDIFPPNAEDPIQVQARVVIHQQEGFGVMLQDMDELEIQFEKYLP